MVFRKTEYRRCYRRPVESVSHETYNENLSFRTTRKEEQSKHEPFCWIDYEYEIGSDDSDDLLHEPIPKNLKKHLDLTHRWIQSQASIKDKDSSANITTDIGVQTPVWKKTSSIPELHGMESDLLEISKIHKNETTNKIKTSSPCKTNSAKCVSKTFKFEDSKSKRRIPTNESKPPFHSYGWANEELSIGRKQSFNVFGDSDKAKKFGTNIKNNRRHSSEKRHLCERSFLNSNCSSIFNLKPNLPHQSEYQRSFSSKMKT